MPNSFSQLWFFRLSYIAFLLPDIICRPSLSFWPPSILPLKPVSFPTHTPTHNIFDAWPILLSWKRDIAGLSETSISVYQFTWRHVTVGATDGQTGFFKSVQYLLALEKASTSSSVQLVNRLQWCFRFRVLAVCLQDHVTCSMEEIRCDRQLAVLWVTVTWLWYDL